MSGAEAEAEPFRIAVPDEVLARLRHRICAYPWDAAADDAVGWRYGPGTSYLRELCAYWVDGFDWREEEARLSRIGQVRVRSGARRLHAMHQRRKSGPRRALVRPKITNQHGAARSTRRSPSRPEMGPILAVDRSRLPFAERPSAVTSFPTPLSTSMDCRRTFSSCALCRSR